MVDPKMLIKSMELCMGAERDCHKCMYCETENDCRDSMIYDAVDVFKVMKQAEWERDVALDQLRQIGKGFGEKMDDIVELMKEQEAVKPIVEQYALPLTNTSVRFIKKHYCGICKEEITGNNVYCHKCGRKVKWDE